MLNSHKLTIVIFSIFLFFYSSLAYFYRSIPPNGDEVHYLIGTISLIKDNNLWMENNYDNKDYKEFNAKNFNDHLTYRGRDSHEYPIHGLFYHFLLVPAYRFGGKISVLFFNAILSSLLVTRIYQLTNKLTGKKILSFLISCGAGLTIPLSSFSILIFTEIFGAIMILELYRASVFRNTHYLLVPLISATILWINVRFLPLSILFSAVWFYQNKNYLYRYVWGIIPTISALCYFIFLKITSGTFNPSTPFQAVNVSTTSGNILGNTLSHLIDRQYGLLTYSPIYIFAIPGFYFWYKANKKIAIFTMFVISIYLFPILKFSDWQGGYTPPARYLVPIIPLLIPSIVFYLRKTIFVINILAAILFIWGFILFLISFFITSSNGFLFIDGISPTLWYVYQKTGFNFHRFFPAYYPTWSYGLLHVFWAVMIIFMVLVLIRIRHLKIEVKSKKEYTSDQAKHSSVKNKGKK